MHSKITKAILSTVCMAACLCGASSLNASAAYALGDVNGDGTINSSDASEILSQYINIATGNSIKWTAAQMKAADINNDSSIDSADASDILSYYAYAASGGSDTIDRYCEASKAEGSIVTTQYTAPVTTTRAATTVTTTTVTTTTTSCTTICMAAAMATAHTTVVCTTTTLCSTTTRR